MIEYLLVRHLLNESQTNLSLPNTPHAIQQKEFSMAELIIAFNGEMLLQFCENVGPACEPNARVWSYGNCCIGYRSVASANVVSDLARCQLIGL